MNNTAELKRELEDIQTRHDELLELEKSIVEVHALFIEVSLLVQSQASLIFFKVQNKVYFSKL